MSRKKILVWSLAHALATAGYVYLVVRLMNFIGSSNIDSGVSLLAPLGFLLLFVISAAITGSLVFGRPLLLYLDERKDEAIALAIYTIAWLFIIMLAIFGSALSKI